MVYKNKLKLMPLSLVLMGLALMVTGCIHLFWSAPNHWLTNGWQMTQADIQNRDIFVARRSRRGGKLYRSQITYSYSWNGNAYSDKARYFVNIPEANQKLPILVNPNNPSQSTRPDFDWLGVAIFGLLMLGGSFLLWSGLKQRDEGWKQLKGTEAQVNGTINIAICILAPLFTLFYLYTTYIEAFT
jgi:hypothetical protein